MFTRIYLANAIVFLRCYKKYSNFLWYFDGNSPLIIHSYLFSRQKLCSFVSVVPIQLVKIANWFSFLNVLFSGDLKIFYGSVLASSVH